MFLDVYVKCVPLEKCDKFSGSIWMSELYIIVLLGRVPWAGCWRRGIVSLILDVRQANTLLKSHQRRQLKLLGLQVLPSLLLLRLMHHQKSLARDVGRVSSVLIMVPNSYRVPSILIDNYIYFLSQYIFRIEFPLIKSIICKFLRNTTSCRSCTFLFRMPV